MSKKKVDSIAQLRSYFPSYTTETLERFIQSNNIILDLWRKRIAEIEHENAVIREEIERRKYA